MTQNLQRIGFSYFTSAKFLLQTHLKAWLPVLSELKASEVIFQSDFDHAIPEDAFLIAQENGLGSVVHFSSELPKARDFNGAAFLLDIYAKRGVKKIILGERPNLKSSWTIADWHYENLIEQFLERFIPLANYVVRLGMMPIFPPLQPGGDYWDTSFIDFALSGLQKRKMESIIENLVLSSYGYSFGKPLTWGKGGPEQWPGSKPYMTPEGQEDQLGFYNFEWLQAISKRILGQSQPVIILNAGLTDTSNIVKNNDSVIKNVRLVAESLHDYESKDESLNDQIEFNDLVEGCFFSLDNLNYVMKNHLTSNTLKELFGVFLENQASISKEIHNNKLISVYLLLPIHSNNVSDVVLNKVRPIIKNLRPTVGFSLEEASYAKKVIIYPDLLFKENQLNQLRSAGCSVEILPESGIEIAAGLQGLISE